MALYLVSCVGRKLSVPAPAKDLYTSQLFRKSRTFVESINQPWLILSAKYGLVSPEQVIEPYDLTLKKMPKAERRRWAEAIASQLHPHLDGVNAVIFLAGRDYQQFLDSKIVEQGIAIFDPMEGMRIGERLRWLGENTSG